MRTAPELRYVQLEEMPLCVTVRLPKRLANRGPAQSGYAQSEWKRGRKP